MIPHLPTGRQGGGHIPPKKLYVHRGLLWKTTWTATYIQRGIDMNDRSNKLSETVNVTMHSRVRRDCLRRLSLRGREDGERGYVPSSRPLSSYGLQCLARLHLCAIILKDTSLEDSDRIPHDVSSKYSTNVSCIAATSSFFLLRKNREHDVWLLKLFYMHIGKIL